MLFSGMMRVRHKIQNRPALSHHRATVWNWLTEDGKPCGQAAMFDRWEYL
jgi:hypothetical protein